jgi:hypothetical protein
MSGMTKYNNVVKKIDINESVYYIYKNIIIDENINMKGFVYRNGNNIGYYIHQAETNKICKIKSKIQKIFNL